MQGRFYFVSLVILGTLCFPSQASSSDESISDNEKKLITISPVISDPSIIEESDNPKKIMLRLPIISDSSILKEFILYPQKKQYSKKRTNNRLLIHEQNEFEIIFTFYPKQELWARITDLKIAISAIKKQLPLVKADTDLKETILQVYQESFNGIYGYYIYASFYPTDLDVHEIESKLSDETKNYIIENVSKSAREDVVNVVKERINTAITHQPSQVDQKFKQVIEEINNKESSFHDQELNNFYENLDNLLNEYRELVSEYKEILQNYKNADDSLNRLWIYDSGFYGNLRETPAEVALDLGDESIDVLEHLNTINLFTLTSLTLGNTGYQQTVDHITSHLKGMRNLTHLGLRFEHPHSKTFVQILSLLPSPLTSLEIYNADLECLIKVGQCKKVNSLTRLKISGRAISTDSTYPKKISMFLSKTPSLETLDFTDNLNVQHYLLSLIEMIITQHKHVNTLILKNIGMTPELLNALSTDLLLSRYSPEEEQNYVDSHHLPSIDFRENPLLTRESIEKFKESDEGFFKDADILFSDFIEDPVESENQKDDE